MTTMRSMNPDALGFVDASAAAARYANFVNEPKYEVATKYFDSLQKEKEAEKLRAEELRRYNQEFGLKQAEANRQQATYDKENRSDKALVDYQSSLERASAGGVMNDSQQLELGDEFDRLRQNMSEEQAAEIITNKAQSYGSADAKKAAEDPYYRAELLRNVAFSNKDISPEKLITLRNSYINREIDLGDRKEEARLTAEQREFERKMRLKEYNERTRERNDRLKEEKEAKQAATDAINLALEAKKDKDGTFKSVNQIGTGSYDITEVLPKENAEKLAEKYLKDEKELVTPLQERLDKLESSIVPEDKLSDQAYLNKRYSEESINPTTQDNSFTSSLKNVYDNANKVINEDKAYEEITRLTNVLSRETDPKIIEDTSNEITRLKDSLDPTKNTKKTSDGKNIESRADFVKRIKIENENTKKEISSLKGEIKNQYNSINENINKDFGKEITKEDKKTLTPDQVLNQEFNRVKGGLLERGYSEYLATKGAVNAANSASQNQKDMINKVDSDVTKLKDVEKKKLDEKKKQLEDELKSYTEIRKSVTTSRNFNGITVDGYFHKKADKAQSAIDNKISSIQKQIKDINGR